MTSPPNTLSVFLVICLVIHGGRSSDVPKNQNRYLAHLFHKYGSHGTISFEVSLLFSTAITITFSAAHSIKYTTLRTNTNISLQKKKRKKRKGQKKNDRGQFKSNDENNKQNFNANKYNISYNSNNNYV